MAKQIAKILNLPTLTSNDGGDSNCAFKINGATVNNNVEFTVNVGLFNGLLPTNITDTFSVSETGTHYIYVRGYSNHSDISGITSIEMFRECDIFSSTTPAQNTIENKEALAIN